MTGLWTGLGMKGRCAPRAILLVVLAAAMVAALLGIGEGHAQAVETCEYPTTNGNKMLVPGISNHRQTIFLGNANVWTRVTVPAGASVSSSVGGGRLDLWSDAGRFAVCPAIDATQPCGSTLTTVSVTTGAGPIWNPVFLYMNGISASQVRFLDIASPVSNALVTVEACKGGN